ncbi:hypothetical protein HGM15179_013463, partial [Zosterops borbonicus]
LGLGNTAGLELEVSHQLPTAEHEAPPKKSMKESQKKGRTPMGKKESVTDRITAKQDSVAGRE